MKQKLIKFYVPNTPLTREALLAYHIPENVVECSLGKTIRGVAFPASVSSKAREHPGWYFPKHAIELL